MPLVDATTTTTKASSNTLESSGIMHTSGSGGHGERVPSITRLTSFTINPPPPPKPKKRWMLQAVEIVTRQVDPEEEFFFNPQEFTVQSVVYQITWRDGHTAEVPVSSIYEYISEDDLEKLENDYFKDNRNPETIYDDDPDYPGGAPSGGTFAYERDWLPEQKQAKARLAPEQRGMRMQMRLGERADVDTPLDGASSVERGDERSYSEFWHRELPIDKAEKMLHRGGVEEEERYVEEAGETQTTYEDELAAQLATIPSREETPMPVTNDRPQTILMKPAIHSSQTEDEDEIDSPIDAPTPQTLNKNHSSQKKSSLPFSPSRVKLAPPNAKALSSSAPRKPHQLPITSMLKRLCLTPQLPPSSPYAGILSHTSGSSSIASFTSTKDTSSSSKSTSNVQAPEKHRAVSGDKLDLPSTTIVCKLPSSKTLPSRTVVTPIKQFFSVPSKMSFAPLNAGSFYGTHITTFPTLNGNTKPNSSSSKASSIKGKSISSWSASSVEEIKMVGIHPGFNPGDYEDFDQGEKLYLVKWEGYPVDQCTWEPIGNLKGSKSLVQEFERNA
ncbi:hypothetical protein BGX38DRAFT_1217086 [Terfezia claveryi]|nr:hypothetical protein BGX38DRAFT_1242526 [Terfezia claveryi]KAF8435581.1 hypothetical protein BGX38DRAFT_1217086 [Terfezia claveryi]